MIDQNFILHLLDTVNTNAVMHCHPEQIQQQLQSIYNSCPEQVQIEQIGKSRDGYPLYALLIGALLHEEGMRRVEPW